MTKRSENPRALAPAEIIRWEDPPARPPGIAKTIDGTYERIGTRWADVITKMQLRPREWAVLRETKNLNTATGFATRIRQGQIAGFNRGEWETTTRMVDGIATVYVRWLPDETED